MTKQQEHVGCIDGKTIVLHHQAGDVILTFRGVEARLSREGAVRLADLLVSRPDPVQSPVVTPPVDIIKRRETIADLVEAGLIRTGTVLVMTYRGEAHTAIVTDDRLLDINGHKEETPSGAGKRVTGQECDGWQVWSVRGGQRLVHLRWRLRALRFLGDDHGYAHATIGEKRMIAKGWVQYALNNGFKPEVSNEEAAEDYLTDRQLKSDYRYADTTLRSYRGHLRHWFNWCKANNW